MADAIDLDQEKVFGAAPASGAQIQLFDSATDLPPNRGGQEAKRLVINIRTSHISAASGLEIQATWDNGASWWDAYSFTVPALSVGIPFSIYDVPVAFPRFRVMYTNSANTLTTWQGNIEAYFDVRSSG
jgi:hypothetical protein